MRPSSCVRGPAKQSICAKRDLCPIGFDFSSKQRNWPWLKTGPPCFKLAPVWGARAQLQRECHHNYYYAIGRKTPYSADLGSLNAQLRYYNDGAYSQEYVPVRCRPPCAQSGGALDERVAAEGLFSRFFRCWHWHQVFVGLPAECF